jgi:hypothetical protein
MTGYETQVFIADRSGSAGLKHCWEAKQSRRYKGSIMIDDGS